MPRTKARRSRRQCECTPDEIAEALPDDTAETREAEYEQTDAEERLIDAPMERNRAPDGAAVPEEARDRVPATFASIPLADIRASEWNLRQKWDEAQLAELAASVRIHGILTPLLVRPVLEESRATPVFEIAAGHRRFEAAKRAELREVPCIIRDMPDTEFLEVLTIENLQREDIHPLAEAQGYCQLIEQAKYDIARIAARVGRSEKYVYDRLRLLHLSKPAQELFLAGEITAGHAILLARLEPLDQKRAIGHWEKRLHGYRPGYSGGLFQEEQTLWDPEEDAREGPPERKTVSVRELAAWVDEHVKLKVTQPDFPDLFPDTQAAIGEREAGDGRVIPITHSHYVSPDARDGTRVFGPRSWKRADGKVKSKTCDHSAMGMVVVGLHRGDAFLVCTKKQCAVHWKREQSQARRRKAVKRERDKEEGSKRQAQVAERQRKEELARERWKTALPRVAEAVAERVKALPAKADGVLGDLLVKERYGWRRYQSGLSALVPRGKSAEDLVRYLAFATLVASMNGFYGTQNFKPYAKKLGIDCGRILNEAAPIPKATGRAKRAKAESTFDSRGGRARRKKRAPAARAALDMAEA